MKELDVTAYLSWSVDVDCPECGESTDLAKDDDDHIISGAIFNNKWEARQRLCRSLR